MGKYICLCGLTHKDKETADLHVKMYEDLAIAEGFPRHKTFKQHWNARFLEWFLNFHWPRFMRFVGGYMIYFVLVHHFHVDWSLWEATLIGIGMGLYID
jgi:hypothetical protein